MGAGSGLIKNRNNRLAKDIKEKRSNGKYGKKELDKLVKSGKVFYCGFCDREIKYADLGFWGGDGRPNFSCPGCDSVIVEIYDWGS